MILIFRKDSGGLHMAEAVENDAHDAMLDRLVAENRANGGKAMFFSVSLHAFVAAAIGSD